MNSPKVIFVDHPYFAINHKDNKYLLYLGKNKKTGQRIIKNCKTKENYAKELRKYVFGENGYFSYSRNEEKAQVSMFDYFMGDTKDKSLLEDKNMLREQMMVYKNGNYVTDSFAKKLNNDWSKLVDKSNIHLAVISFNQDYIDENVNIIDFQKDFATKVLPKFFKECGYQNPNRDLDWCVSLHNDRENNYHFHFSWIEKKPAYLTQQNKLKYKLTLNLDDIEINFIKRQSVLAIERHKSYTPALTKLNKDIDEFTKYFNPKDKNFTLKNNKDLDMEIKIIRLGYLLSQIRSTSKTIKYNSLPNNDIGKEIRYLTNELKKDILSDKDINLSKKDINKGISNINDIFLKIDEENNISNIGFESAWDNKLIQDKLEKSDNYVLNAIVNHSLFKYRIKKKSNENITINDLINEVVLSNYKKEVKDINTAKKNILKSHFDKQFYKNKYDVISAFNRLGAYQEKVAEQFYEMLSDNEYKK